MNKQLLMVVHSQSGRNMQLALAAFHAVRAVGEVDVRLLRAFEAEARDVIAADALMLFTPEMLAAVSGGMKEFIDRVFYPLERAEKHALPYVAIIACGNDGQSAERQLDKMLRGINARKINDHLIIHGEPNDEAITQSCELALAVAEGLQLGIF